MKLNKMGITRLFCGISFVFIFVRQLDCSKNEIKSIAALSNGKVGNKATAADNEEEYEDDDVVTTSKSILNQTKSRDSNASNTNLNCSAFKCRRDPRMFSSKNELIVTRKTAHWFQACGNHYIFSKIMLKIEDAEKACCYLGMRLLAIQTTTEFQCLLNIYKENFQGTNRTYWTSGSGKKFEDLRFDWCSTGTPIIKDIPWKRGKSNNLLKNEKCVTLAFESNDNGLSGVMCVEGLRPFICEASELDLNVAVTELSTAMSMIKDLKVYVTEELTTVMNTVKPMLNTAQLNLKVSNSSKIACTKPSCAKIPTCSNTKSIHFSPNGTFLVSPKVAYVLEACGRRFVIGKKKQTLLQEAARQCCQFGMKLVSFETAEKLDCFNKALKVRGECYHTTGTNLYCSKVWWWCLTDVPMMENIPWFPNQPDNKRNSESQLEVCFNSNLNMGFSDVGLFNYDAYICELKQPTKCNSTCPPFSCKSDPTSTPSSNSKNVASIGILKSACNKRLLFSRKPLPFTQAAETCCKIKMSLLILGNVSDQTCLQTFYEDNFLDEKSFWVGGSRGCGTELVWCQSGSSMQRAQLTWRQDGPKETKTNNTCLAIVLTDSDSDKKFAGMFMPDCSTPMMFICQE